MKTRISMAMRSLWIVALLFVAQQAHAQSFEGRIVQTIKVAQLGNDPMEAVMNVKGDKLMMAMDAGPQGTIKVYPKSDGSSMTIILEQMKMGMEINTAEADKLAQQASTTEKPALVATGKKETVNGYACEEWTFNADENRVVSIWATGEIDKSLVSALRTATKVLNSQNPDATKAMIAQELMDKGLVAVRTSFIEDGEAQMTLDLIKIEKSSIPDSIFEMPKDITIQKVDPSMMGK